MLLKFIMKRKNLLKKKIIIEDETIIKFCCMGNIALKKNETLLTQKYKGFLDFIDSEWVFIYYLSNLNTIY